MEIYGKKLNFSKKKVMLCLFIIVAAYILYLLVSYVFYQTQSVLSSEQLSSQDIHADEPIGEIVSGTQVIQTIPIKTNIAEIQFLCATYARENAGTLKIEAIGVQSGIKYADLSVDVASMKDNSYVSIPLEELATRDRDSSLNVQITSDSVSGSAVTIWRSNQDVVPEASLTLNGAQVQGDLVYSVAMNTELPPYWNMTKVFALLIIALIVLLYPGYIKPLFKRFIYAESEISLYIILFLLGFIILFFRSAYNFITPSMYAEDGVWLASIINNGLVDTLFHARGDYLVFGNVMLLQAALSLNQFLLGNNINYLPVFVAVVQYAFYCFCAVLPVWCFKRDISKVFRIMLWLLILLVPVGITGYEIWGKVSNTGFMFYFIAFCLLFRRIFYRSSISKKSIILGDILLFICCGTHEGVYVLVAAGFILDAILQFSTLRMKTHAIKVWFSLFYNRMWIALGVFCAAIALYDLLILTANQHYAIEGNIHNVIELCGRLSLFYITFPFYRFLSDKIVIGIFVAIIGWIILVYRYIRKCKMDIIKLSFCIAVPLFYCIIALVARFDVLSGLMNSYLSTYPDRFYYAINISCLIPIFFGGTKICRNKANLLKCITLLFLFYITILPIVDYRNIFPYDDPQTTRTHQISFAERLEQAIYDPNLALYNVPIDPAGWGSGMIQLPEKFITASIEK